MGTQIAALLAAVFTSAGCSREPDAAAGGVLRLLDLPATAWSIASAAPNAAIAAFPIGICGDLVRGNELAAGATASCTLDLPSTPSWLDVDVATLLDGPVGVAPPPVQLEIGIESSGRRRLLLHTIPRAGQHPSALGFGHARVELVEDLGKRATLSFTLVPAQPPPAGRTVRAMALCNPRITPRVSAAEIPWCFILFRAETARDEIPRDDGLPVPRWPAFAALEQEATWHGEASHEIWSQTIPWEHAGFVTERSRAILAAGGEVVLFAVPERRSSMMIGGESMQGVFDRWSIFDPYVADLQVNDVNPDASERWGAAVLAERMRELGEDRLFLELARPRAALLFAAVSTRASGAPADNALARLIAHLKANDLWDRTLICALFGRAAAIRVPPGWRERTRSPPARAFAELAEEVEGAANLAASLEALFPKLPASAN